MRQILLHLILLLATLEVGGSFARIPLVAAADESTSAFRSDTREAFSACQGSDHSLQAYMRGYLVNYLDYQRSGNKDSRVNAAKCEQVILDQHLLNHAKAAALIAREGSVGHAGFDKNLQAAFDNKLKSSEEELRLYLKALEYIESQARQPSSASAVAKLAFSLQRAWEAKYELLFYQQNRDQLNNSTQLVTDLVNIGAAAGTTRSLFATKYVKNYFTVFNKTFQDVLGLEFKGFRYGVQASTELNRKEGSIQIPLSERKISLLPADMKIRPFQIPPPPSYVLHMAFPALDERLIEAEESAFVLDSVANGASMLAFTVALNVEHKLLENKAIPKKLRLFAVIGSAALTYAATEWGKDI